MDMGFVTKDEWLSFDLCYSVAMAHEEQPDTAVFNLGGNGHAVLSPPQSVGHIDTPVTFLGGTNNFYHWVADHLSRLRFIKASPDAAARPLLVNRRPTRFQKRSLELLGIGADRLVIPGPEATHHVADLLVLDDGTRPHDRLGRPDWWTPALNGDDVAFLRDAFDAYVGTPDEDYPTRIFLSRADALFRRCVNEEELHAIAEKAGFSVVQPEKLPFEEQIRLFAGAEAVVGVHGAGFTNMIFAPGNCGLLELHPASFLPSFFQNVTRLRGQRHFALSGPIERVLPTLKDQFASFTVDPADFTRSLEHMLDSLSPQAS